LQDMLNIEIEDKESIKLFVDSISWRINIFISILPPNQALKLTEWAWEQFTWLMVVFRFYYSVFSTYNYDTYQFGYQRELVSFSATWKLSAPQLSAGPLGRLLSYFRKWQWEHLSFWFQCFVYSLDVVQPTKR
jgi:hypothetical protein